jgi:hypothetical protein
MLKDKLDSDLGIKDFSKCDFEPIREHLNRLKARHPPRSLGTHTCPHK